MKSIHLVWMIWVLSFKYLAVHGDKLFYFVLLPIVALSFLGVATVYEPGLLFANVIMHFVFVVMFAAAWHSYILAPKKDKTVWQYLKWDKQKWQYLGCFLLFLLAFLLSMNIAVRPGLWLLHGLNYLLVLFDQPALADELLPPLEWGFVDLLAFFGFLALCYPLSRAMFIFPLIALGRGDILNRSLALSGGAVAFCFVLFLSLGLFQLGYSFTGFVFRHSILLLLGDSYWSVLLISELVWQGFNYLTLAFMVTALSFGFDILDR